MKRVALITIIGILFFAGAVAQQKPLSKNEQRRADKEQNQKIYEQRLESAIQNGTFYFDGQTMQVKSLDRYRLQGPYNMVEVEPEYIRVRLPYFTSVNTMGNAPSILDFESDNFTYTYTYTKSHKVYVVTINISDVKNRFNTTRKIQSSSYKLTFTIPASNGGHSTLSLSPGFTATIQYQGRIDIDN